MGDDTDDMDIEYLDLEGLEKVVQDTNKGIIHSQQWVLLKEAIIKSIREKSLRGVPENPNAKIQKVIKKNGNER